MVAKRGKAGGANCTLSYTKGTGKRAQTLAYRVRAATLAHGVLQVATESHGRTTRAYYPHRKAPARFSIGFLLLGRTTVVGGTSEYVRFNKWLGDYMRYMLDQDDFAAIAVFPQMTVSIPSRNFLRRGIPLGPLQYGEHVGSILWNQNIDFETTFEPLDTAYLRSSFDANGSQNDRNTQFFYPSSPLLSGNQKPDVYDGPIQTIGIGGGVQGTLSDGVPSASAVQAAVGSYEPAGGPTSGAGAVRAGGL